MTDLVIPAYVIIVGKFIGGSQLPGFKIPNALSIRNGAILIGVLLDAVDHIPAIPKRR